MELTTWQAPAMLPQGRALRTLKNQNDELKAKLHRKAQAIAETRRKKTHSKVGLILLRILEARTGIEPV